MLKSAVKEMRRTVRRVLRPPLHAAEVAIPHTVYGTEYGGWPLIDGSVDAGSAILSVGLGEDISFDLEVIERFRCQVHGCDPTPKSLDWIRQQPLPPQFHLHAIGLGEVDGTVEVVPPANDAHVSFSATRGADQTAAPVTITICTLQTMMDTVGIKHVEVLKMDIEGFEYGVVQKLVESKIRPEQLLIEFHHRMYTYTSQDTHAAVEKLRGIGYKIFYVSDSGHEYGFVQETGSIA